MPSVTRNTKPHCSKCSLVCRAVMAITMAAAAAAAGIPNQLYRKVPSLMMHELIDQQYSKTNNIFFNPNLNISKNCKHIDSVMDYEFELNKFFWSNKRHSLKKQLQYLFSGFFSFWGKPITEVDKYKVRYGFLRDFKKKEIALEPSTQQNTYASLIQLKFRRF